MIPREDWKWRGMPGHLIVSTSCCFHMVTDIGRCRVSSIGCYHPSTPDGEKNYDNRKSIGCGGALYETFVFPIAADGEIEPGEIWGERFTEEADTEAAHVRVCEMVASLDGDPEKVRKWEESPHPETGAV